eukprot:6028042-Pleurochrysis_carterae.AAC.1
MHMLIVGGLAGRGGMDEEDGDSESPDKYIGRGTSDRATDSTSERDREEGGDTKGSKDGSRPRFSRSL